MSSLTEIEYARDVPWKDWIARPISAGTAERIPCGRMIRTNVVSDDSPSAADASRCAVATDCSPARMVSDE